MQEHEELQHNHQSCEHEAVLAAIGGFAVVSARVEMPKVDKLQQSPGSISTLAGQRWIGKDVERKAGNQIPTEGTQQIVAPNLLEITDDDPTALLVAPQEVQRQVGKHEDVHGYVDDEPGQCGLLAGCVEVNDAEPHGHLHQVVDGSCIFQEIPHHQIRRVHWHHVACETLNPWPGSVFSALPLGAVLSLALEHRLIARRDSFQTLLQLRELQQLLLASFQGVVDVSSQTQHSIPIERMAKHICQQRCDVS
mmetsp:Transcript_103602/g.246639  ORF Transcript_103602/g.246639 Transcript_103602/m.246639 type:complete len:251 (-) Transcript_103602:6017-6769(-)